MRLCPVGTGLWRNPQELGTLEFSSRTLAMGVGLVMICDQSDVS